MAHLNLIICNKCHNPYCLNCSNKCPKCGFIDVADQNPMDLRKQLRKYVTCYDILGKKPTGDINTLVKRADGLRNNKKLFEALNLYYRALSILQRRVHDYLHKDGELIPFKNGKVDFDEIDESMRRENEMMEASLRRNKFSASILKDISIILAKLGDAELANEYEEYFRKDFLKYYYLEDYLFNKVSNHFQERGFLTPEEFFCIIIWKANRAKSKIKNKILKKRGTLAENIRKLTNEIFKTSNNKEKLSILLDSWKFGLPMATAILTVLYPNDFTVYDVRVRNQLGIEDFSNKKDKIEKYFSEFLPKVKEQPGKNLRDKDRYLWGKSFYKDLKKFLKQ